MDTEPRTIVSGITTVVIPGSWGQVTLDHHCQGESVVMVKMTREEARKLFRDLSFALGHHDLDDVAKHLFESLNRGDNPRQPASGNPVPG